MSILAIVPVFKRPEILHIHLKNCSKRIKYLYVLSHEDKDLFVNQGLIEHYGHDYIFYPNQPLGEKMNEAIKYALKEYNFRYLMNLGSDDIFHDEILKEYDNSPYQSFNSLYIYDYAKKDCYYVDNFNADYSMGACRIIGREILEKLNGVLYDNNAGSGLDTDSHNRIVSTGYSLRIIKKDDVKICDIKTATNINPIQLIKSKLNKVNLPKWLEHCIY